MSLLQAKHPLVKHPSESITFGVNVTEHLIGTETVASVGTVTAESGLTVGSGAVNSVSMVDTDGETCAANYGVTFTCSGGSAGSNYLVTIPFTTSGGRTLYVVVLVQVRDR